MQAQLASDAERESADAAAQLAIQRLQAAEAIEAATVAMKAAEGFGQDAAAQEAAELLVDEARRARIEVYSTLYPGRLLIRDLSNIFRGMVSTLIRFAASAGPRTSTSTSTSTRTRTRTRTSTSTSTSTSA